VRFDVLLLAAVSLVVGGLVPLAPLAVSLGFCAALLGLWRSLDRARAAAFLLLFGLGALRSAYALKSYDERRFELRDALGEPRRCAFEAEVVSSPVERQGTLSYLLNVTSADCEAVRLPAFRARSYGGPPQLARGDRVRGVADFAPVQLFRNLGAPDPRPGALRGGSLASGGALELSIVEPGRGLGALIDRARAHVRARIQATFPPLAAPLSRALVLGESDLLPEDDAAFRASGLSHLLAVSGTHLVFAVVALVNALSFLLVRVEAFAASVRAARAAAAVGVVLSLGYADFAGGSGSAFRAAYMLSVAFLVTAAGRRPSPVRCLAASILLGALLDPLVACDISFLLSVAATGGLIGIGPWFEPLLARVPWRPLQWLAQSLATTLSAMLPCVPLLALLGSELGIAGLFANVVAAPIGEVCALPLCLLHAVVSRWPWLEQGAAMAGGGALLLVRAVAHLSAAQSELRVALPVPSGLQLALLGAAVVCFWQGRGAARVVTAVLALLGLVALERSQVRAGAPRGLLTATVLDVGQGDSALLGFPDGALWLIDGGGFVGSPVDPGRSVILPELLSRRRERIDVMVLSHPHPDHFLGLVSVVREVEVGELWDTGQGLAQGAGPAYAELQALLQQRGVKVRLPRELCGLQRIGGVRVHVLAPCPGYDPRAGANDNSFVIRFELGRRALLFTGDAEHEAEQRLLASGAELRADFLKVGHHGSRTSSTPAFLERVAPRFASISSGVRNRFGHPQKVTLHALAERNVTTLRTDRFGAVQIETDGEGLALRTATGGR
jgi:competence protein ComEC